MPWYESVALAFGAASVTTVEYGPRVSEHPQLRILTPAALLASGETFDTAFSISSFEHDGLGRYGDPLNGRGDLDAMGYMRRVVAPGGHLLLAVPRGRDCLVFNLHRVYGPVRWSHLVAGWAVDDSEGPGEVQGAGDGAAGAPCDFRQPVFLLRHGDG